MEKGVGAHRLEGQSPEERNGRGVIRKGLSPAEQKGRMETGRALQRFTKCFQWV